MNFYDAEIPINKIHKLLFNEMTTRLGLIEKPVFIADHPQFIDNCEGKVISLFPSIPYWFLASNEIIEILKMFTDAKSVEEISENYSIKKGIPIETVVPAFRRLSRMLFKAGVIRISNNLIPIQKTIKGKSIGLDPVGNKTVIALTQKCNLRCIHCSQSSGKGIPNELEFEEIMFILDDLKKINCDIVMFTGGEIFCRKDTPNIIEHALKKGFKVTINTNGLLITDEIIYQIVNPNLHVRISLDGANKEPHEYIRGKNTFDKTINTFKKLIEKGISTGAYMMVHKGNIDELEDMFALTHRLGIRMFSFNRLFPVGRQKQNRILERVDDMVIFEKIYKILKRMPEYKHLIKYTQYGGIIQKVLMGFKYAYRNVGRHYIFINADGLVYPNSNLLYQELRLGNIREKKFSDIIQKSTLLRNIGNLKMSELNEKCSKCIVRHFCGGGPGIGGMSHTYAYSGNFTDPYPYCEDYKRMILSAIWVADEYKWLSVDNNL